MTTSRPKKEAIRLTELWQSFGGNTYPLDIDELILGAIQNSGFDASLETVRTPLDSLEGCLLRVGKSKSWKIMLNENIGNARRQRFTHGHELGHFLCHRNECDRFEDDLESLNDFSRDIEREANEFAAWLLMPANLVRSEFNNAEWQTDTLRALGSRFECSLQASALRFIDLNSKRRVAFVVSRDGFVLWAVKSTAAPFMSAYRFGDELPKDSHARQCAEKGTAINGSTGISEDWNENWLAKESQYFETSGLGYQYTCIEFDR